MGFAHIVLFSFVFYWVTRAKLNNELFKLFAKVLLAFRPFAMCLKMMKFCRKIKEGRLLEFLLVWCCLVVSANVPRIGLVREFEERQLGKCTTDY